MAHSPFDAIAIRHVIRMFLEEVTAMPVHRVAIAAATLILAAGVFVPVAPAGDVGGNEPVLAEFDGLRHKDCPISVQFENEPASKVLEAIAAAADLRFYLDGPDDCCLVSLSLDRVPLRRALEVLATKAELRYEIDDPDHLRAKLFEPLSLTDDMTMPALLTRTEPVYPEDALAAGASWMVFLEIVIREDGTVGNVTVVKPDDGWPSATEAVIAAVRRRTYRPATLDGHPVSVYYPYSFRLLDSLRPADDGCPPD